MKELVIISGKGGTGKTSIAASFAHLAGNLVTADCDVDAANLHLVMSPVVRRATGFSGGKTAVLDQGMCSGCGKCLELCRYDAVSEEDGIYKIDKTACEGCGVCAYFCPVKAIDMVDDENGEWYVSDTAYGPMVHARLNAGGENSGKLVTLVRGQARRIAKDGDFKVILVDGSPGIGCPVIASITGADAILAVTEPSMSGLHDLKRVVGLAGHFGIRVLVAVNKFDINPDMTDKVLEFVKNEQLEMAGRVHYDIDVTLAQVEGKSVVEFSDGRAASDIRELWRNTAESLELEV
ncbi:MAG: ATP-binding protein [Candidatus Krumholzibacteriota bacterium]|nr:ATP-binding protein [Candidatus Krumholzibacteriota bacterium]